MELAGYVTAVAAAAVVAFRLRRGWTRVSHLAVFFLALATIGGVVAVVGPGDEGIWFVLQLAIGGTAFYYVYSDRTQAADAG